MTLDRNSSELIPHAIRVFAAVAVFAGALATAQPASAAGNRVFEMRTYTTHPGKLDDLHKRFREHTNRIFQKHGMELIAYWTPTEETVRDAIAQQLILNKEYGTLYSENPLQGSFFSEALTDAVEERVLSILDEMSVRGGVLGSIETGYQRSRIQQENLDYEMRKNSGEMPIVGVNTFVDQNAARLSMKDADEFDIEVTRADDAERQMVVDRNRAFKEAHAAEAQECLENLKRVASEGGNVFECIMGDVSDHCTLGQITEALMQSVGQFRRDL